ncbi:hypothetical protein [Pararobbsia alpina]|uniref:Uncharacterized protein n=1 Tax=Pararobbsia alpina TaxID=621374 RepID=A0A6S7BKT2_9BURK|nr:hypothetical protein [Pararobbsia alpina]CAB3803332.1 hypothetical protein LMG28138_05328 [Pararobbsia alpina]
MTGKVEQFLREALAAHARSPEDLAPLRDICRALIHLKREDELLPWADKALALNPSGTDFVRLRTHALTLLGRHSDAVATWLHYASLPWGAPYYQIKLGHQLVMAGDFERGIPMLTSARQVALAGNEPFASAAEHLLGEALLKTAQTQGFAYWLARNQDDSGSYLPSDIPAWAGQRDLRGKRILVTHQLGYGDQVLLFSCIPHWIAAGATLMISCDPPLHSLLKASLPQCVVVSATRPTQRFAQLPEALVPAVRAFAPDMQISLLHLPILAAERRASPEAYFRAYVSPPSVQGEIAAEWAKGLRLTYPGKALIGLFWDCSQRHYRELGSTMRCWATRRSLPLSAASHLLTEPKVEARAHFVGLHHPSTSALAGTPAGNISQYGPVINDFADTAACIEQLDAVIAVDSVVANLSAMMGKPTAVLTHSSGDWRWGSQGSTTPWMHDVKVLRQRQSGDWSTVVQETIDWLTE